MKKTFTFLFTTVLAVIVSAGSAFAQPGTFYPNYFINHSFDGIEAFPSGYSGVSSTSCFFGHAAASYTFGVPASGFLKVTGGGSGTRGGEFRFPSTATSAFKDSAVWVLEFDWTVNAADWRASQANGIFLMGPNSANVNVNDTWYGDVIFGLYNYKSTGYFHLLNLDPIGLPKRDAGGAILPGEFSGPVFYNQNGNNGKFARAGASSTSDFTLADSLNMSTRTKVLIKTTVPYHVYAEMNFKTQKLQKFMMYEIANPANGDTILDKDFLAPWMVGTATTVDLENRKVTALDRMASFHTRSGGTANLNHSYDNWKVYTWKESVGVADVAVKYVDQYGNPAKDPRVLSGQQVNSTIWLATSDKTDFASLDGQTTYFYDAIATHAANLNNAKGGSDGESLMVDFSTATTNYLTVVFKKVTITAGTYIWNGDYSNNWSYVDDNFKVLGGSPMSYQSGNPVEFSNATPVKDSIAVVGEIALGASDMLISAPGYKLGGTGRIVGTGQLIVNAPVTLGADIRLEKGAVINTDSVTIKNAGAANTLTLNAPVTKLVMQAGATFSKAITGAGNGTLNLDLLSNNEYASAITKFATINIHQKVQAKLNSSTWGSGWGGTLPDSSQVNIINDVVGNGIPNGFGVTHTVLQKAKLHLGPNTRLVRQYNENSNNADILYIGELSGEKTSRLETGFVDNRYFTYNIGGFNSDAVFNGEIGAFTKTYTAATETTPAATTYAVNGVGITKSGTGSWTVNGDFNFCASTKGSQVNVTGGKFLINGNILFPNVTKEGSQINVTGGGLMDINGKVKFVTDSAAHVIKVTNGTLILHDSIITSAVNQLALTVENMGTLKTGNSYVGAYNTIANGTVEGGGTFVSFSMTDSIYSNLKLNVNSFTEGDFDVLHTMGDVTIRKGAINVNVKTVPSENKVITIVKSDGNYDIDLTGTKVFVNGVDITANKATTEIPANSVGVYYFTPEDGTLGFLKGTVGLSNNTTSKEIKSIEYFNALGQKTTMNNAGYTIQKVTYTDNSIKISKAFNLK
jgi:hypothetical protein